MFAILLVGIACIPPGNIQENCHATVSSDGKVTVTCGVTIKDPPGSDLCNINASQGLLNYTLTNATITSTTGTFTAAVTNANTGATLGQNSFGYTVQGSSVYAQNPTALQNWLGQFCSYSDVNLATNVPVDVQTQTYGSASLTSGAEYQGTTYASATQGWTYTNPKQLCNPSPCRLGPSSGGK